MTDNSAAAEQIVPEPSAELRHLGDRLIGRWQVSGGATGTTTFEWLDGGFFLVQRGDLDHDGRLIRMTELIGQERRFGEEPGEDLRSRVYDSQGNTLDYVYELAGNALTIWGGEKGSPAYYRGTFSADGGTVTGGWVWPGGGYESTMTRVGQ